MLQLITATGCRPEAFALCERWMAAQTYDGPARWLIVDDGAEPTRVAPPPEGWTQAVIRRAPFWKPGQNTQAANLLAGIEAADPAHPVVVIEDDDYYAPGYLADVARWLETAELVGEDESIYYHVGRRVWRNCANRAHASLCSTAVRGAALALLRKIVAANPKFIDIDLWRDFRGPKALHHTRHVVGIKGLPGRGGIGAGHRMSGMADPALSKLRALIGPSAASYAGYYARGAR